MKKIILFLLCLVFSFPLCAVEYAPIANLEYIHNAIASKHNIIIPYNPAVTDITLAANMKYLLSTVDVANKISGTDTNYGTSEFATEYAANIITVNTAVDTLINLQTEPEPGAELLVPPYVFALETNDTSSFSFNIAATGTFVVDWGDGTTETITPQSADNTPISHTYESSTSQTIRIGGLATGYNSSTDVASISFASKSVIKNIYGSLGKIFPTMTDGSQPSFYRTFYYNYNLSGTVPKNLFTGVTGAPRSYMFYQTFYNCGEITDIPESLFGGLDGAPASSMFYQTFYNCYSLKKIPNNLFGNLYGQPALNIFYGTFYNCTGLTGEIPLGLFGNLNNYYRTYMFYQTFYNCSGLTGPSARTPDGTYFYDYFTTGSGYYPFSQMYRNCSGLSDYNNIPSAYK